MDGFVQIGLVKSAVGITTKVCHVISLRYIQPQPPERWRDEMETWQEFEHQRKEIEETKIDRAVSWVVRGFIATLILIGIAILAV